MQRRMNGNFAGERDLSVLLIGNSLFLLEVSASCLFLYIFGLHATLSSFMPARQGTFVRDTLGLVLGKCCKVRHSVTKPYKQLHITVGNITYV